MLIAAGCVTVAMIVRVAFAPFMSAPTAHTPVPLGDLAAVKAAVRPETVLIWCETPTNPLLSVADIAGLAGIAHDARARLVVDNTFASPYLQQPLALGADVVVHSTTKYLGGHSDVVGGALVTADTGLGEELAYHQNALGAIAGAFDAWLVMRGAKTLGVRMDRHCANAQRVVELLQASAKVSRVLYPGLAEHPGHDVAAKQITSSCPPGWCDARCRRPDPGCLPRGSVG